MARWKLNDISCWLSQHCQVQNDIIPHLTRRSRYWKRTFIRDLNRVKILLHMTANFEIRICKNNVQLQVCQLKVSYYFLHEHSAWILSNFIIFVFYNSQTMFLRYKWSLWSPKKHIPKSNETKADDKLFFWK